MALSLLVAADAACVRRLVPSPNGRERCAGENIRYVILHGTWMADDEAALARLCDPAAEVSSHYYITRAGEIIQMVAESRVAHHAGKSYWLDPDKGDLDGLNPWSIGIEIGNAGPFAGTPTVDQEKSAPDWSRAEPYTEAQYQAVVVLLCDILARNPQVIPARVLGHADIAPGRKTDPGLHFDWQRLAAAGVCVRPE